MIIVIHGEEEEEEAENWTAKSNLTSCISKLKLSSM
jgi:hypothetical protein